MPLLIAMALEAVLDIEFPMAPVIIRRPPLRVFVAFTHRPSFSDNPPAPALTTRAARHGLQPFDAQLHPVPLAQDRAHIVPGFAQGPAPTVRRTVPDHPARVDHHEHRVAWRADPVRRHV